VRLRGGKYYIHYQQYYKDIPVYKSYLSFVIDQNNKTNKILCNLYKDINLNLATSITSQNSESVAIEHFLNDNQVSSCDISSPAQLLILPKETAVGCNYILTYKVVLEYENEYKSINNEYFIDANTANIVDIRNNWREATLSGSLRLPYYQDYNSSVDYIYCGNTDFKICNSIGQEVTSGTTNSNGTFSISFSGATGQYYYDASIRDTELNQWCYTNLDNSDVQVQGTFNWSGSSMSIYPYFYESSSCMDDNNLPCNVYYHVNKMHDYFTGSPFNFSDMNYKMYAYLQCYDYWNGSSDGINIKFGEQNGISWAKSASCINHEYSHCLVYHIYDNAWIGNQSNNQSSAMDEGFADYFDCAYRNDDVHCEGLGDAERHLSNSYEYNSSETFYWNSQVISGACWDVRSTVTDINVDLLVFNTLLQNPHSFSQFLDCMLEEEDDPSLGGDNNISNGTPHIDDILIAFYNHGIYPDDSNIPPLTPQDFSGTWYNNHPKIYWTANTESDFDHYEIHKKIDSGSWSIKATVTNNYYTDNSEYQYTGGIKRRVYYKVQAVDSSVSYSGYTSEDSFVVNAPQQSKGYTTAPTFSINPVPTEFILHHAFPNPFNASTTLKIDLPEKTKFSLVIYDINGSKIWCLNSKSYNTYPAGCHTILWDGRNNSGAIVPTGVYFVVYNSPKHRLTQKVVLMK
jgi:hypothetical protein